MESDFMSVARRTRKLLTHSGFVVIDEEVDPISDNGFIDLQKDHVVLRVVRDRKQWFVETRYANSDEWFDSRFVLTAVGDTQRWYPPKNEQELIEFVEQLVRLLPRWELLFQPSVYQDSKRTLNEMERAAARD